MRLHHGVRMLAAVVTLAGVSTPAAYGFESQAPGGARQQTPAVVQQHPAGSTDWLLIGVAAGGAITLVGASVGASRGPARGRGVLERWRERRAESQRRVLVQWLRRTANRAEDPHPIARRRQPLLHYRSAAVRSELLEIAAALERAHDPDRACVAELHELLANGCDSPLYNPDIHVLELRAAMHYLRAGLLTHP